jgi:hypothetical protein
MVSDSCFSLPAGAQRKLSRPPLFDKLAFRDTIVKHRRQQSQVQPGQLYSVDRCQVGSRLRILLPKWGKKQAGHALYPSCRNASLIARDTSRCLLICTDCRDTDTAADVSYRPTRTVTSSSAPSQSPVVLYKKQDFTSCIYRTGYLLKQEIDERRRTIVRPRSNCSSYKRTDVCTGAFQMTTATSRHLVFVSSLLQPPVQKRGCLSGKPDASLQTHFRRWVYRGLPAPVESHVTGVTL